METKTIYIAFDGKEFDNELDCLNYERDSYCKRLSTNCIFLDEEGRRLTTESFFDKPDRCYGIYAPTIEDARIIDDICAMSSASSPWENMVRPEPGLYWYLDKWENVDSRLNYWERVKKNFFLK